MSRPTMIAFESRAIQRIGYDPIDYELWVEWAGGDTYIYALVPMSVSHDLVGAKSKGRFLHDVVKPRYPVRRAE